MHGRKMWLVGMSIVGTWLCAAAAAHAEAPAAALSPPLAKAFADLAAYEFGKGREPLTLISDAVRDSYSKPEARAPLVANLAAVLSSSAATTDAKRFVCRQLAIAGTAKEVPPLAALLTDKDLADMARYALERIPDPSVDAALRAAFPKATPLQQVGIINSLGERRSAASAATLTPLLKSPDAAARAAAAAALGKIGGAAKDLAAANAATAASASVDALLQSAERLMADGKKDDAAAIYEGLYKPAQPKHVQIAALGGLIMARGQMALPLLTEVMTGKDAQMQGSALKFLRDAGGNESAKTVAGLLPKVAPATQVLLLDDLAARGDPSTAPTVLAAAQGQDANVNLAAVRALGRVGGAAALPVLLPMTVGSGALADEARRSLDRLPGADVNPALIAMVDKAAPDARAQIIRTLGVRRAAAAVPVIAKAAEDANPAVRMEAGKAIQLLADEKAAPAIVSLVVKARTDEERQAAEQSLASLCGRAANKGAWVDAIVTAMTSADVPAKAALIRAVGRAGGAKALAAVKAASAKDAPAELQDAAVRAMADWPDATVAPDLVAIAKDDAKPANQVLAIRGLLRLSALPAVDAAARLKLCLDALAAAKRPEEKKLAMAGLGALKDPAALKAVEPYLGDDALKEEAAAAAVRIARNLGPASQDQVKAVMPKVIAATKDVTVHGPAGSSDGVGRLAKWAMRV